MSALEAVIFDLDDTLFDHRSAAIAGVSGWLESIEVTVSDELVALWFTLEFEHFGSYIRGEVSYAEQRRRRLRDMLEALSRPVVLDPELDLMFEHYAGHYLGARRPFDDVEVALTTVAARGLRIGILTNGTSDQQHDKLATIGLTGRVGPMICSDTSGLTKPDPRAFHAICEAVGVVPGQAVYVGDSYELDVVAARAAGLHAIHIDRFGEATHPEAARIASLHDLEALLSALCG